MRLNVKYPSFITKGKRFGNFGVESKKKKRITFNLSFQVIRLNKTFNLSKR